MQAVPFHNSDSRHLGGGVIFVAMRPAIQVQPPSEKVNNFGVNSSTAPKRRASKRVPNLVDLVPIKTSAINLIPAESLGITCQ